ncbi:DUF4142 domain-containing protein [Luteibacter flocculans]|uniref:DUF4142 domain-containing protein n=1 Tax=Luteibacter flocculans TaxID=2780091 RepID=A0ABY4T9R1_9GAMM|nr:DUF4142 domain-containing protein [Luteibacter flocculans]URL60090.1 DUF4142 domain-containing protein [Luteibacter flocculans]
MSKAGKALGIAFMGVLAVGGGATWAQQRGGADQPQPAGDRKAQITPTDEGFVRGASDAYQMGSRLATLTAARASDPAVKSFGAAMVKDFIALSDALKPAASGEKGYQWAEQPAPEDSKILGALERMQGKSFDEAVPVQFVALLEKLRAALSTEIEKGHDPQVKPVAQKLLPTIENRLHQARALNKRGAVPRS